MIRILFLCIIGIFFNIQCLIAQVSVGEKGKISGTFFGDFYWMARHHDASIEGNNGFWIRRIYLTYDQGLSKSFSARIRLEASSPGDFQTNKAMIPDVKDAYLKWQKGNHQILAGISPSPTLAPAENVWGYRSVEKSPLDLFGMGSSRDFGISLKGSITDQKRLNYHFFVGNGNGNKAELDKGKKLMLSLSFKPAKKLIVETYGDWNSDADGKDTYTIQGFLGYTTSSFKAGVLYAFQERTSNLQPDRQLNLASVFTNFSVTEKVRGFLRADHLFNPYLNGASNSYLPFAPSADPTFLAGGADIIIEQNIHLIPNIEAIVYDDISTDIDLVPRMTLFFTL